MRRREKNIIFVQKLNEDETTSLSACVRQHAALYCFIAKICNAINSVLFAEPIHDCPVIVDIVVSVPAAEVTQTQCIVLFIL